MGKKNKNKQNNDDMGDDHREGDFTKGFVSHKETIAQEAAAAQRDQGLLDMGADSDDENNAGQKLSKKQKNKRKQKNQEDDGFDDTEQIKAKDKAGEDSDGPGTVDIKKAMEENFEGNAAAKRNTRKKKNNQGGLQEDAFAGVFDDHSGSDKDEVYNKKGGYKNKKREHQGKKKKKQDSEDEAEPAEEEKFTEEEKVPEESAKKEEPEDDTEAPEYPLKVIYCPISGVPPEYSSFAQKDITECKKWLRETHPLLFTQVYNEDIDADEAKVGVEEEKKEGDEEAKDGDGEEQKKPKKKVKMFKEEGIITIHKQVRGGKKCVSQMVGFEHYTKDLKGLASKFGKKFSCGCNLAKDDILGDCISIQGDIEYRLEELIESDKDLQKLQIPVDKIRYEEMGNKKGRKR